MAYDLDSGDNGQLRYSISLSNRSASLFLVDAGSGVISLGSIQLPRDVTHYNIVVSATDNGVPQLSQQALLRLQVSSLP